MTNGSRTQSLITIASAIFAAGVLWARVGSSAAHLRQAIEEIRAEQRAIREDLAEVLKSLTH